MPAKKEEVVRQLWLRRLTTDYRYPIERIQVEYPITFGRDTSKRADIVVFDEDRRTIPYIMIEVKAPKLKDGKDQLNSYTHATGAPLAMWSSGYETKVWNRLDPNKLNSIPDIPRSDQTIEDIANEPWTIAKLIEFEKERELAGGKAQTLRNLIVEMEDDVLANLRPERARDLKSEPQRLRFASVGLGSSSACSLGMPPCHPEKGPI